MADTPDDSFDEEMARLIIPSPTKIQKLSSSQPSTSSSACSSSQSTVSMKKPPTDHSSSSAGIASNSKTTSTSNKPTNPYAIAVNPKQRGNPILKSITSVPYEFRDDIVPDYVVGRTTCILYLSLKYHNLNPDYILRRLKTLGTMYELRVLLVQVDTVEPYNALKNLTRVSLLADLTLMLAWNADEAGKIIETYKSFENKPPDLIMERIDSDPHQKLVSALTSIKPVNKTDALTLLQNFGTLANIINSTEDRLSLCTGLGPRKAKKLHKTLQEQFMVENGKN